MIAFYFKFVSNARPDQQKPRFCKSRADLPLPPTKPRLRLGIATKNKTKFPDHSTL